MANSNNHKSSKRPRGTNYYPSTTTSRQKVSGSDHLSINRSTTLVPSSQHQASNMNQQIVRRMNKQYHHILGHQNRTHELKMAELTDQLQRMRESRDHYYYQLREVTDDLCRTEKELKYTTYDLNEEINKANTTINDLQNKLKDAEKREVDHQEDFKEIDHQNRDLKERLYGAHEQIEVLQKELAIQLSLNEFQSRSESAKKNDNTNEDDDEKFWCTKYYEANSKYGGWIRSLNEALKQANDTEDELRSEIFKLNQAMEDLREQKKEDMYSFSKLLHKPSVRGIYNDGQSSGNVNYVNYFCHIIKKHV